MFQSFYEDMTKRGGHIFFLWGGGQFRCLVTCLAWDVKRPLVEYGVISVWGMWRVGIVTPPIHISSINCLFFSIWMANYYFNTYLQNGILIFFSMSHFSERVWFLEQIFPRNKQCPSELLVCSLSPLILACPFHPFIHFYHYVISLDMYLKNIEFLPLHLG